MHFERELRNDKIKNTQKDSRQKKNQTSKKCYKNWRQLEKKNDKNPPTKSFISIVGQQKRTTQQSID